MDRPDSKFWTNLSLENNLKWKIDGFHEKRNFKIIERWHTLGQIMVVVIEIVSVMTTVFSLVQFIYLQTHIAHQMFRLNICHP